MKCGMSSRIPDCRLEPLSIMSISIDFIIHRMKVKQRRARLMIIERGWNWWCWDVMTQEKWTEKAKVKLKVKDKDTTDHVSMEKLIFIDESVIDPSHQNQPDRQEVRVVTGWRQGHRSHRVTLFLLKHWQHPLNLLAWKDPQRVGGYLPKLIGGLELAKIINGVTSQSVCLPVCLLHYCVSRYVCESSVQSVFLWKKRLECEATLHPYISLCTSVSLLAIKPGINTFIIHKIIMDLLLNNGRSWDFMLNCLHLQGGRTQTWTL